MRRLVIIIFLAALCISRAEEYDFTHVKDIEINTGRFADDIRYFSTQFYLRNRQRVGKHNCFNIFDIIKQYTPGEPNSRIVVVAESPNRSVVFGLDEIDPKITIIPAILVFDELTGSVGDTVTAPDKKGMPKGNVDLQPVKQEFAQAVMRKIHLQLRSISPANKEKYFKDNTLMFPQDRSTGRWMTNVKRLRIYRFEK
jgi:hypothetical protein